MHRYTKADVRTAMERYVELTGDTRAEVQITSPGDRYGTRYEIINARTSLNRNSRAFLGAENAWRHIHAWCDGYTEATREEIMKVEVVQP